MVHRHRRLRATEPLRYDEAVERQLAGGKELAAGRFSDGPANSAALYDPITGCPLPNQTQAFCNMKTVIQIMRRHIPTLLLLTNLVAPALAQEVSIPDPGLNAAIRAALQKPDRPLTKQDLLSLTVLQAPERSVGSLEGLEAARNWVALGLQSNLLANFSLPSGMTVQIVPAVRPGSRFDLIRSPGRAGADFIPAEITLPAASLGPRKPDQ
jgi:hypothetical protein